MFKKALHKDPIFVQSLSRLGEIYSLQNKILQAKDKYKKAL